MTRFGWSLPPGVSHRMIDDLFEDPLCEPCGSTNPDDCICPECTICGEIGNPKCYYLHGLTYSREQQDRLDELDDYYENEKLELEEYHRQMKEDEQLADEYFRSADAYHKSVDRDDGPSILDD